ncbi:MAG: biopolymer transporter ExbD [Spirochaetaceae bacterium]|jgi:biopolymer transport protein ExbD|nr:biopolymer transporter ExbD [Spirochaetaceae bacterium]GMO18176.1 MAG: biopolymer transporter ExbD [Termitinemataceae bacterium]
MKLKRKKGMMIIPTNAMSDVAFLLLIFIMLVALINYRKEVKIDYPEAHYSISRVSDKKNLEIWINNSGLTFIDGTEASLNAVQECIDELYRNAPDTRIHILADKNAPYKNINNVLQILQLIEYRVVSFVVKDES